VFRAAINDAKAAVGDLIAKYAVRASVAVPFVLAFGFGTAALTLVLVERFGSIVAYALMAAGFAAVGLVAAALVAVKEQEEESAQALAEEQDTADVATDAAAQAAVQLPLAFLGTLFSSPAGPGAAVSGARMIGRHLPLVVLLALIAILFWPTEQSEGTEAADEREQPPEEPATAWAGDGQWRPNGLRPAP
jgi:hypothetical protein